MKTGRLEFVIHLLCWSLYTFIAVYGRGQYWNAMEQANIVMAFVSLPVAFFFHAFYVFPHFFKQQKWGWYGMLLLAGYVCLETIRAVWIASDPNMPDFQQVFMGKHDVLTPVFFGYLFSFVYASVKNWIKQNKEIEQLKKANIAAEQAVSETPEKTEPVQNPAAPNDFFFVQTGNAKKRLAFNDILYISGEGNYVYYITATEKVLVRKSIREVLQTLPVSDFIQIHRSFVVALRRIEKVQDNHVYIAGERIPVSSTYREVFLQTIDALS